MKPRWVEIDLDALRANYRALRGSIASSVRLMAVVKSAAYGHGMVEVARCLAAEGVDAFGVAEVAEGVELRREGIEQQIVVFLGATVDEAQEVARNALQPVVYDQRQLDLLSRVAGQAGVRIGVHVKIDTGMGRLGMQPAELDGFLRALQGMRSLYVAGIMSHCPCADDQEPAATLEQNRSFAACVAAFAGQGASRPPAHLANSAAMLRFPETHWEMVRPGLALYGCPPAEADWAHRVALAPVMSLKTRVLQVKEVAADFGVSYGHTFRTPGLSRLAVLPVGYNDGYLRALSNRVEVLIRGQRAPQRGRVCMNATVVDVTSIAGVAPGDEVVLLGRQGNERITADEVAGKMGTISYEVLCLFGGRNPRAYVNR